jgi:cell division protease FtsH
MVTKWGLSEKMGPLMYDEGGEEVFLGRSAAQPHQGISDETATQIDKEVRRIIDECYATSQRILEENVEKLHMMADALMTYETIDSDQIDDIMAGREPRQPSGWDGDAGGNSASGASVADDSVDNSRPIGGPAGEH